MLIYRYIEPLQHHLLILIRIVSEGGCYHTSVIQGKKFAERTIFVLSDMEKSKFRSVAIGKIKEKISNLKISIHTVSENQTSTPFGDAVPIRKILQNSGYSRKMAQRRATKTPFYLFNSAEDSQLEMKLQTLGKSERSKLG